MTGVEVTADRSLPRHRRGGLAVLVVVLLVAAAAVGAMLLRSARQGSTFAAGRPSLTGAELIKELGTAVARKGSGHLEASDAARPSVHTGDFVVHDGHVDVVYDAGPGMRVVAKNGVAVAPNMPPVNLADLARPGGPDLGFDGAPAVLALGMKALTFQEPGVGDLQQLSAAAVYTRTSTADDGSTVWTGSWTAPGEQAQRYDIRLTVDAAGLPVELRRTMTHGPGVDEPPWVVVTRYSRWGQPVQIPEPTPFSTP
jgi:hypothetical protein